MKLLLISCHRRWVINRTGGANPQNCGSIAPADRYRQASYFEIDEACKITRKAKPTIYTLAHKGLIPAYKRGKKLYFYEDELLQWIESVAKVVHNFFYKKITNSQTILSMPFYT